MTYCINCGAEIIQGAKYCQKCGAAVLNDGSTNNSRQQEFVGKIYKCPNCGEKLPSFTRNCPSCGFELRSVNPTNSVKEFSIKLEAIEANREYEKPRRLLPTDIHTRISKTDEQKINLIKNFSIPNTKEDMLEFMILATSNLNMKVYDTASNVITKGDKALNDAWLSKINQVYEKAKHSYGKDADFQEIKRLYDSCFANIEKAKNSNVLKYVLMIGWIPLLLIVEMTLFPILHSRKNTKEEARLDAIVVEIEKAIDDGDFKYALRNAQSIEYDGYDKERERWWNIKKDTLIDTIVEKANENGVQLEAALDYTTEIESKESEEDADLSGGFVKGFMDGLQPGLDAAKENIDEFNRIMNEGTSADEVPEEGE